MHKTLSRQNPGKSGGFWKWSVAIGAVIVPLLGAYLQPASSSPEPAGTTTGPEVDAQIPQVADQEETTPAAGDPSEISDAPAKPVSTQRTFPANIHPSEAMSQIVSLAESGVEESLMLAFVTNSATRFSLGSSEIIYLNDIGVPPSVITAMLEHDKTSSEITTPAPLPPPQSPPRQIVETSYPPSPNPTEITEANYPPEASEPLPEPGPPSDDYTSFYDPLAPYGTWVDVAGYGRCWQPTVVVTDRGWQPYLDCGRWVYTDCGWYWKSDYSWGWAPFHYGRWFRHQQLGWCWAPGSVWAPSWVCWRYTTDYCGWAPLPPSAAFTVGVGLSFHGRPAKPFSDFHIAADCFPFVPLRNFCDHYLRRHAVAHNQAAHIYKQSTPFAAITPHNHSVFNHGIAPERVSAASHVPIQAVAIRDETQIPSRGARETLESRSSTLNVFRLGSPAATQTRSTFAGSPRTPWPTAPAVVAATSAKTSAAPAPAAPAQPIAPTPTQTSAGGGFVIRGDHWLNRNTQGSTPAQMRDSTRTEFGRNNTTPRPVNSFNSGSLNASGPMAGRSSSSQRDVSRNHRSSFGAPSFAKNDSDKNRNNLTPPKDADFETSPVQQPFFGARYQNSPFTPQRNAPGHRQSSPNDTPQQQPDPGPRSGGQIRSSPSDSHRSWPSGFSERARGSDQSESRQSRSAPAPEARESRSAPPAESHQSQSAPASSPSSSSSSGGHSSSSSSSSSSGKGR